MNVAKTPADFNRGRQRAQRLYHAAACSACGAAGKKLERHHADGNPLNNSPENVQILCVRCHMVADGRLAACSARLSAIGRRAPRIHKGNKCSVEVCDRPAKYKGLCNSHYYRARNNGGDPGTSAVRNYRSEK